MSMTRKSHYNMTGVCDRVLGDEKMTQMIGKGTLAFKNCLFEWPVQQGMEQSSDGVASGPQVGGLKLASSHTVTVHKDNDGNE